MCESRRRDEAPVREVSVDALLATDAVFESWGGFLMCGMSLLREALCVCVSEKQS